MPGPEESEVIRCANELAARLPLHGPSFDAARQEAEREYTALLDAVRRVHARFDFDRAGRPGAIDAVREALPIMERDLFDAVLEDHACELAAVEEAFYGLARVLSNR